MKVQPVSPFLFSPLFCFISSSFLYADEHMIPKGNAKDRKEASLICLNVLSTVRINYIMWRDSFLCCAPDAAVPDIDMSAESSDRNPGANESPATAYDMEVESSL
ncbi:hypothetical protein DL89DRAFT_268862 [Linderina pennispora]|uniref:Secreted protein n=1 Tax=Linderina pennispora TaxID=61395 RepID=A0A1Y1W4S5_9FUNG|nr:uncharacterized protein DL89DRAFT_268862 [Linderina pennispora]ORX68355.1 hypothetical protein DL89DRAFT_268862 [Linderina pennispora]